jgi:hypothetical protein
MKTRPSQQNKTNFERSNATSHTMQVFLTTNIYFIFIWVAKDKFFGDWSTVNLKGKIFKQNIFRGIKKIIFVTGHTHYN